MGMCVVVYGLIGMLMPLLLIIRPIEVIETCWFVFL